MRLRAAAKVTGRFAIVVGDEEEAMGTGGCELSVGDVADVKGNGLPNGLPNGFVPASAAGAPDLNRSTPSPASDANNRSPSRGSCFIFTSCPCFVFSSSFFFVLSSSLLSGPPRSATPRIALTPPCFLRHCFCRQAKT